MLLDSSDKAIELLLNCYVFSITRGFLFWEKQTSPVEEGVAVAIVSESMAHCLSSISGKHMSTCPSKAKGCCEFQRRTARWHGLRHSFGSRYTTFNGTLQHQRLV